MVVHPLVYLRLCAVSLSACLTFLPAKCFQVLQQPVLCPHMSSWWIFHQHSNNHRWLPHEVRQCQFSFVTGHEFNSEVSENRPLEHTVPFSEQHDSSMCHLPQWSRNLVELRYLDLHLGLLLFFRRSLLRLSHEVAPRVAHSGR